MKGGSARWYEGVKLVSPVLSCLLFMIFMRSCALSVVQSGSVGELEEISTKIDKKRRKRGR